MQDCCRKGFLWNGTAVGQETTLKIQDPDIELNVYVTGNNSDKAVLFNHDALGWKFNNTRLLADHFAKEIGATVYLPDLYVTYSPRSKPGSSRIASMETGSTTTRSQ